MNKHILNSMLIVISILFITSCRIVPGQPSQRSGNEILIAGERIETSHKVVLWTDNGGFDAYRGHRWDQPGTIPPQDDPKGVMRYGSLRRNASPELTARLQANGWTRKDLTEVIDTVVLHYDACGSASRCFHVLHNIRGLSCHFLVDVDGTIYQTLDVKERAWHAGNANDRSIGIEIAHFGAFKDPKEADLHYIQDTKGIRLNPDSLAGTSAENAHPYPARPQLFEGTIHQEHLHQRDFTEAQYIALENLLISLCRSIPSIQPRVPRDSKGKVVSSLRDESKGQSVAGIVGHWHVGSHKVDPGPAFDWDRIEKRLQEAVLVPNID